MNCLVYKMSAQVDIFKLPVYCCYKRLRKNRKHLHLRVCDHVSYTLRPQGLFLVIQDTA